MDNEDITPLAAHAIGLKAFSNVYLELVEGLIKKGLHPSEACQNALNLVSNYMGYVNNNNFAKVGSADVTFIAEDEG